MTARTVISRPEANEYPSFGSTYVNATTAALPASGVDNVHDLLSVQLQLLDDLMQGVTDSNANRAYADGKWSLKESIVHMSDTERVFSYRAMRIARADRTPLPGYDQDDYAPESRANRRSLTDILAEFRAIRQATIALVSSLDNQALSQIGTASNSTVTPRGLTWMIAGHAAHHLTIIRERYLPALT